MAAAVIARTLAHHREEMRFREPFRISGYLFESMPAVVATIGEAGLRGRGEAAGVYYLGDDPRAIEQVIESCRAEIEAGLGRGGLRDLLPPGGARNALDCALWELESLLSGVPVWRMANIPKPRPLVTTFTLPADDPAVIVERLDVLGFAEAIKLKLEGDIEADRERLRVVRRARPDVWLGVDANQGFGGEDLDRLIGILVDARVGLLEQPIRRGEEALLDGFRSPIPIAADESIQDLEELWLHGSRFQVMNIKLDKCGGLTEALMIAEEARRLGMKVMVGNMAGSTLSTAPAFVLAQVCDIVDLDGPFFLAEDPQAALIYRGSRIMVPASLWGCDDGAGDAVD